MPTPLVTFDDPSNDPGFPIRRLSIADISELSIYYARFLGHGFDKAIAAKLTGAPIAPADYSDLLGEGLRKAPALIAAIIERGTNVPGEGPAAQADQLSIGDRISLLGLIVGGTIDDHGIDKVVEAMTTAILSGSRLLGGIMAGQPGKAN